MSNYLVIGGASGIGRATSVKLAGQGHAVVIADLNLEQARAVCAGLDGTVCAALPVNVRDRESVDRMAQEVQRRLPQLDGVAICAGIIEPAVSSEISDDSLLRVLDVHLMGMVRVARALFPQLSANPDGSSVVAMSSMGAHLGLSERLAYCVAKGGVEAAVKTLAVEWAKHHVRVNAIAPAWVNTPAVAAIIESGVLDPGPIVSRTPLGRLAEPSEIAELIAFMLSGQSGYMTGTTVVIDGGMMIQGPY